ncbi:flagellar basal body rod protein [Bacillaceae bacterium W0354]
MPKWLWITLVIVLSIVTLVNLGPLILLGISVWVGYILFKQWFKTDSTGGKVAIIIVGIILLNIAVSNMFALIGLAAGYGLYVLFKKKDVVYEEEKVSNDPFTNFEKEWAELQKL